MVSWLGKDFDWLRQEEAEMWLWAGVQGLCFETKGNLVAWFGTVNVVICASGRVCPIGFDSLLVKNANLNKGFQANGFVVVDCEGRGASCRMTTVQPFCMLQSHGQGNYITTKKGLMGSSFLCIVGLG